ncbi:MAG: methionine gamma-lyase family protein, partial [Lachnospiraceae bacterium]|nr:methionine gamma-lyase family protein [Lachnospiraceae bacterium]
MFNYPDINPELLKEAQQIEESLKDTFRRIDDISEANQYKVLNAFRKNRISEAHLGMSTGYGYNDAGRDDLEKVYADIFHTEDALVRPQITCGTHAIYLALSANLLPGDELIYITGKPYDSLEMAIGIVDSPLSLKEMGVSYKHVEMIDETEFDYKAIEEAISDKTRIIAIQRSKGYKDRASLSPEHIGEAVKFVKHINSK